jgi:hypothetical protein
MGSHLTTSPRSFVVGERAVIAGGLLAGRAVEVDEVRRNYYNDGIDQLVTIDLASGMRRTQRADALR